MSKRFSKVGWTVLATLLSLVLLVLPACSTAAQYHLTIATPGGGSTNPAVGAHAYDAGTKVNLVATPDEGYEFVNWTGDVSTVANVNAATTTITVDGDYFITANFEHLRTSVLKDPQGYPADPNVEPVYGGTLKILHSGSGPTNIGAPWVAGGGRDAPMGRFAVEKLVGLDDNFDITAQLATSWSQDSNAKTITFILREGVKFHDGTDFNAAAAKWCLDKYRNGTNTELKQCTAVEVVNDYTVKLVFSTWDPNMLRNFVSTAAGMMVSPTWAQAHTDAEAKLYPVGTGPFKFKSYTANTVLEYEKFADYWQEGLPYLDGVKITFVSDETVRLASFLKKEGDVINEISTHNALYLEDQGYEVVHRLVHLKGIAGDMTSYPFNDIRFRQAMAYAIPTATIVNAVFEGQYTPTNQLALAPGWTAYNTSLKGYPYNVTKAKALLAELGISTATPYSCKLIYQSHTMDDYLAAVQASLHEVGIDITPQFDIGYYGTRSAGWTGLIEYQFSYNGFELTYDSSLGMAMCGTHANYKNIVTPPELEAAYSNMKGTVDLAIRELQYKALNAMAIDQFCMVVPQYGFEVEAGRQAYVHDFGYGVIATEYCPEKAFMSAH